MIYWWTKHSTACVTSHAVSHKIQISFLKNQSKTQTTEAHFVWQVQTDTLAANSGYSLYSSGSGEVQVVAPTEHGKDKFNIVHFCANALHLQYLIPTSCTTFIYCYNIFRPAFLVIFVELVFLLMCAVYMSTYLVTVWIFH